MTAFAGTIVFSASCSSRNFSATEKDLEYAVGAFFFMDVLGVSGPLGCDRTYTLPVIENFKSDGNPSEFGADSLFLSDPSGDAAGGIGDLRNVHFALDGKDHFLVHFELEDVIQESYIFNLFINNSYDITEFKGIFDINTGWQWQVFDNYNQQNCSSSTGSIAVSGKHLEMKIPFICGDFQFTPPEFIPENHQGYPHRAYIYADGKDRDEALYPDCIQVN